MIGFDKSGITDKAEQKLILEERINDMYVAYELEDFVHLGKELSSAHN